MSTTDTGRDSHGPVGMIWAQDRRGVLGARGAMLWRVPADFRHFRAATTGCGVVMGHTTWTSLAGVLKGRRNVVLSRRLTQAPEGALLANSLPEALGLAAQELDEDPRDGDLERSWPRLWIIGGGQVYAQAMEAGLAQTLVITTVDTDAARGTPSHPGPTAPEHLVLAPAIDPVAWTSDPARSDPPGSWRERSGDAAWRVDTWVRRCR